MNGEFDIIRTLFAPLAKDAVGSFNLKDDAALLATGEYVVTKDLIVAGVHFLEKDPLDLVARKLLRVNLSDLAAKGARAVGYFLGCVWPKAIKEEAIARFAQGLAVDQELYRIALFGGDTTKHRAAGAPLTLSATLFGTPPRQGMMARGGASVGDDLYVTGTIGDAGLGLAALEKRETFSKLDRDFLVARYRLPEPRLTMGGALAGHVSAALDVSDGLIADAGHLARESGVAAVIDAERIPLSEAAGLWLAKQDDRNAALGALATFGDDYEILFAAPPSMRRAVDMASKVSKTRVRRIGQLTKGSGVTLHDLDGHDIDIGPGGYDHFG
ncbi:MAG: thiamine-phosphate kinase [Pseudomonadota bacterium]|nr:thiamine-phosphate kinase [Pseudomonadota bacterium]